MSDEILLDGDGIALSGEDFEDYCRKHGLCHLCARVRTHKRVFQLLKKNKWQPLTITDVTTGEYTVYKGYCLKPDCFTLDQAKRLLGETDRKSGSSNESTTSTASTSSSSSRRRRRRKLTSFRKFSSRSKGKRSTSPKISEENGENTPNSYEKGQDPMSWGPDQPSQALTPGEKHDSFDAASVDNQSLDGSMYDDDDMSINTAKTSDTYSVRQNVEDVLRQSAGTLLDLSAIKLRPEHMSEVVAKLSATKTLKTLLLENCKLNDTEVEILAQGLVQHARDMPVDSSDHGITKLSLRFNSIGNRGAVALCEYLKITKSLRELDMSKNYLGSRGAEQIIRSFTSNPNAVIQVLNLANNEIWDLDDGTFVKTTSTLQIFNLEGNFIHDEGIESIANGISENPNCKLEKLLLGWNAVGDDGTKFLANMIEVNSTIKVLGLGENEITNTGGRAILSALAVNKSLREISGLYHNHIDRKFIIVAIKRLLHSHNQQSKLAGTSGISGLDLPPGTTPSSVISTISVPPQEQAPTAPIPESSQGPGNNDNNDGGDVQAATRRTSRIMQDPTSLLSAEVMDSEFLQSPPGAKNKDVPLAVKSAAVEAMAQWDWGTTTINDEHEDESQPFIVEAVQKPASTVPSPAPASRPPQTDFDRLTMFQSAPLAYFDRETEEHHSVLLHDFEHEALVIKDTLQQESAKINARVELEVEIATPDRLKTFLANPESRFLHLSCHGHPDCVALENGFGYMEALAAEDLTRLMKSVDTKLEIVFITSHHAKTLGKTFVEAGVRHVVCCPHEETFRDVIAIEFVKRLYAALARNRRLKQAFEMACEAVRCEERTKHFEGFFLLPEKPSDDPYHDVPVFFTKPVQPKYIEDIGAAARDLPAIPRHFLGREVDMYEILEALRVDDVVRVGGGSGSGKTSIVAAVSRYILQRKSAFHFDDIFWLPPIDGVKAEPDSLYGDLCQAILVILKSKGDIWDDEEYMECRERIEIELEGKRTIIVMDSRYFATPAAASNLEQFLGHLLNDANVKIIVITSSDSKNEGDTIHLRPVDFKSTCLLFGEVSRFITTTGCPAAQSPKEFASLMIPPSVAGLLDEAVVTSRRRQVLSTRMGAGVPGHIIQSAETMSTDHFIDLISVANLPEVQVDSFGALEKEHQRRSAQKETAVKGKNYLRAEDLGSVIGELDNLRPNFPSPATLVAKERTMKRDLAQALAKRDYETANGIKRELLKLKKQIMEEKNAMPQKELDSATTGRLLEIQAQVQSMMKIVDQSLSDSDDDDGDDGNNGSGGDGGRGLVDEPVEDSAYAEFTIGSVYHECNLLIHNGTILEKDFVEGAFAVVSWTNECCDLEVNSPGLQMLELEDESLAHDVGSLPPIARTRWGLVKCGTGNAVIVGPGDYGKLKQSCVILAVGPLTPSNDDVVSEDDVDTLQYVKVMLRSCYRSSLVLAKHSQLQGMVVPTLTTKPGTSTYEHTLRVGLATLVEEARFSELTRVHIVASSEKEAMKLVELATNMGIKRV